jgi:hypothetical protein
MRAEKVEKRNRTMLFSPQPLNLSTKKPGGEIHILLPG